LKTFSEEEMKKCHCAFKEHFNLASFYAYMKLREQELRNLMWITECIAQDQKDRIIDGLVDVGNEQHT
jgi:V-type H+-transporting ATPase subunit d